MVHVYDSTHGHPRLQFLARFLFRRSISSIFHSSPKQHHTIFKWTRTGSQCYQASIMLAASEKLIKLLINRFCVKHKYELRRFFSFPSLMFTDQHPKKYIFLEYARTEEEKYKSEPIQLLLLFFADFIIRDYLELERCFFCCRCYTLETLTKIEVKREKIHFLLVWSLSDKTTNI